MRSRHYLLGTVQVAPSNSAGNLRAFTAGHGHLSSREARTAEWGRPKLYSSSLAEESKHIRHVLFQVIVKRIYVDILMICQQKTGMKVTTTHTEGTPSLWVDYNSKEGSRAQRSERHCLRSRDRDRYGQDNKTTFRPFDVSVPETAQDSSLLQRLPPRQCLLSLFLASFISFHDAFMSFCVYVSMFW